MNIYTERNGADWYYNRNDTHIKLKCNTLYTDAKEAYYNIDSEGTICPLFPQI